MMHIPLYYYDAIYRINRTVSMRFGQQTKSSILKYAIRCVADSLLRVYNRFSSNTHFPQQLNSYCSRAPNAYNTIRENFSPALDKTKHTQYCENKRKENDYTMNVYRRQQRCRDFGVEPVFANCLPVQCCAASGTEHAPIVAFGQRDDVHFFIILHISKTVSQKKK